jgi:hypothetical protein
MKKARAAKIFISALVIVGFLVFLTPYFLKLEQVRIWMINEITHQLEDTNSTVNIKAIYWQWLPFPSIAVSNAVISNKQIEIKVPKTMLFPDWPGLFLGRPGISRVVLNNPNLYLKSLDLSADKGPWSSPLLSIELVIKNGSLALDPEDALPGLLQDTNGLKFSNVMAEIDVRPDRVDAAFTCTPPPSYAKNLEAKGYFIPSKDSYDLWIKSQDFKLHKILISSVNRGTMKLLDSDVNLEAAITGTGLDHIEASVKGDFPYLKIESNGKEMHFSSDYTDLSFKKQGQEFQMLVSALELTDPELTLSGVVERSTRPNTDESTWHVDLKAKEVDLSGFRERVLTLFGRQKLADLVCSIVLGGKAREATYFFVGTVQSFRELKSMTITAEVDEASVHVPNVDLDLKETRGQIEIRNGILTGRNLSGRLGDSMGTNGSITLGLVGEDKIFNLDMVLDADLSKLPSLLHRLVNHHGFRSELAMFSNLQGKTSGHLILGDRLKDISAQVTVSNIEGTVDYERIKWPIKITEGQLQVFPDNVKWSHIKGSVGPHSIHETEGDVRWKDGVFLDIRRLNASLDSGPLFSELKRYQVLQQPLSKLLFSIDGPLEATDVWLKGPVNKPLNWEYGATIDTEGIDFHSPLLPGPSHAEDVSLRTDQKNVQIFSCKMRLSDQQIDLNGDLRHRQWRNWQGSLDLSGTIRKGIAQWVKAKAWIPNLYFPGTPCSLNHLKVAWDPENIDVKGEIISDLENKKDIKTKLDISSGLKGLFIKALTITTPVDKAILSVNLLRAPERNLLLNWEGCLKGETLDKILEKNAILSGHIKGLSSLCCSLEDPSSARLNGTIEASQLKWLWGVPEPIYVNYANLEGHNSWSDIEKLSLEINDETVVSKGRASFSEHNIDLDLDLKSGSLSLKNLSRFIDPFKEKHPFHDPSYTHKTPNSGLSITGKINFNLDRFKYKRSKDPTFPDKDRKVINYIWQPLMGQVKLLPQGKMAVSISSGTLCGLNTTGTWRSGLGHELAQLVISTNHEKEVLFQDVLSCLGQDQDILEGSFSFNADIEGIPGNWQRGTVELRSSNGTIRRMTMLSKIFSVLNVIDLFSPNGLPNLFTRGFPFSLMDIKGYIKDNNLIIDYAIIEGKGLNLFGSGTIELEHMDLDMTVLVAPLKTIDTIISKVPLLGKVIGGKNAAVVTFPVKIKGKIKDPEVTTLSPDAVGGAMVDLVKNTLMLPFQILSPIFP